MAFSATDAVFEGFRVVRRHPMALVFWALAYGLVLAVIMGLFAGPIAEFMATTERLQGADPDPAEVQALGMAYLQFMALVVPIGLLFGAVLNAAVARAVLRPDQKAFGYMRLGADEVRVLAVTVALAVMFGVGGFVAVGVVGVAAGLAGAANVGLGILVGLILGLGAAAGLAFIAVRLSLAVPITLAEKRIAILDSFALTRGHFWALFGMAILAFIMTMLVSLLSTIVALPVTLVTGGLEGLAAYDGQSTAEILSQAGPAIAIWVVLNAIFSALQLAVLYAPFSAAYIALTGQSQG